MPTRSTEAAARSRADANFKKEAREKEGAKAMLEYQASGREVRENMAKLKALRLAKEAAEAKAAAEKPPAAPGKASGRKKAARGV